MLKKLIVAAVSAAVIGVLVFFAAITVTFIPGVAVLYPASAFEAAVGSWFGVWGAIASYLGLLVAGTGGGWFALPNGLALSFSDFAMAMAPAIAVRHFGLDPELPNFRHMIKFVLITLVFGSFPGSLWYNWYNMDVLGLIAGWNSFWVAVVGWNLGNLIILIFIGIPVLKFGTPVVKQTDLYIRSLL